MGKLINALSNAISDMERGAKEHAPEILFGTGIALGIATIILSVKATPKAMQSMDDCKKKLTKQTGKKVTVLTKKEVVQSTWKHYIPAAVTGTVSGICLFSANSMHLKRTTVLAAACNLYETAYYEYRAKTHEIVGEKKSREIEDQIAKDQLQNLPKPTNEVFIGKKGNVLFYEPLIGKYFVSDYDKIEETESIMKERLKSGNDVVKVNDVAFEYGIGHGYLGTMFGWDDNDAKDFEIRYTPGWADDGQLCAVLSYYPLPHELYSRF